MFKNRKTIKRLKSLERQEMDRRFLSALRLNLVDFMKAHPAKDTAQAWPFPAFSFRPSYVPVAAIVVVALLGGAGVTFASQGSLPGEKLYPIKILTENISQAMAFSPAAKERLGTKLAIRRIEEIKAITGERGADPRGLSIALDRLEEHLAGTAETIAREKDKGRDVSDLARAANHSLSEREEELSRLFKTRRSVLDNEAKGLKEKIIDALKAGDQQSAGSLKEELKAARAARAVLLAAEDDASEALEEKRNDIEKNMEARKAAEQAVLEAKKAELEMVSEYGQAVTGSSTAKYAGFLAKAEEAFQQGHFVQARQLAKQAKESLKHLERIFEKEDDEDDNEDKADDKGDSDGD